jgi:hypothetical protein
MEGLMNNRSVGKLIAIGVVLVTLIMGVAGCGSGGNPDSRDGGGIVEKATKYLQSEGRSYEHVYTADTGMTLSNSFFDWTVKSVESAASLIDGEEEILPSTDANKFIIADIIIKNNCDQEIPVGNYDYVILWEDENEESHEDNAFEEFMSGMYPNEVTAQVGETVGGKLIFEVPMDVNEGSIAYYEYYEDEFEGDAYLFSFFLEGDYNEA